jgi:hypothetical protein
MTTVIDVYPPNGDKQRHMSSWQTGDIEVQQRSDGGVVIVGVNQVPEVRGWDGDVGRPASRTEMELASYPPGTAIDFVSR